MTPEQKRFVLHFVKQLHNCIEDRARTQINRDATDKSTDKLWPELLPAELLATRVQKNSLTGQLPDHYTKK